MSLHRTVPNLQTERLNLRPIEEDDFLFLRQLDSDPIVMKYIGNGKPKNETETRASISKTYERYAKRGTGMYIVEDRFSKGKIGRAGLFAKEENSSLVWEIGLALIPSQWRKGYGKEIAICLRDWAYQNLDAKFVVFVVQNENLASAKLAKCLGMKHWKDVEIDGRSHSVFRTK